MRSWQACTQEGYATRLLDVDNETLRLEFLIDSSASALEIVLADGGTVSFHLTKNNETLSREEVGVEAVEPETIPSLIVSMLKPGTLAGPVVSPPASQFRERSAVIPRAPARITPASAASCAPQKARSQNLTQKIIFQGSSFLVSLAGTPEFDRGLSATSVAGLCRI